MGLAAGVNGTMFASAPVPEAVGHFGIEAMAGDAQSKKNLTAMMRVVGGEIHHKGCQILSKSLNLCVRITELGDHVGNRGCRCIKSVN